MRVTFYSVNIGQYDYHFPVAHHGVFSPEYDVRWVLFSDVRPGSLKGWTWQPLPEDAPGDTATEINRYCKFFPHKLFPEADISVYLDANVVLTRNIAEELEAFIQSGAAIGLGYVDKRHTIQAEGEFIARTKRFDPGTVDQVAQQIARYERLGLPESHRLMQGRVIFRRHGDPALAPAMQTWWDEFMAHSRRDQISLPYVIHYHDLALKAWDWSPETGSPLFYVARHRPSNAGHNPAAYIEAMRHSGRVWPWVYRFFSPIYALRAPMHRTRTKIRRAMTRPSHRHEGMNRK